MRITDLQAHLLSSPFPQPMHLRMYGGERIVLKRDMMLIRVLTDRGLVGYASGLASETVSQLINRNLRSAVVNLDPTKIETLRKKIFERRPQFPGLTQAYGAVEMALFDLKGKIEGCPVSELLGGRVRNRIRLYGTGGVHMGAEMYVEEAVKVARIGFTAYKIQAGLGLATDREIIQQVRAALPPVVGVMVDANAWWRVEKYKYDYEKIEQLAREISHCRLTWLEEPLEPQNRVACRRLRETQWVPIAAGEYESDAGSLMSLATDGIVDVVQGNFAYQGGYIAGREVLQVVDRVGRSFAFENCGTPLDALAMAQLGICFDEKVVNWLEWPCSSPSQDPRLYPFPLTEEILKELVHIEKGEIVVPDSPGLGIEVNEDVIGHYPWKPGPMSVFKPDD